VSVHVFELGTLNAKQRSELTLVGRLKALAHGGKTGVRPSIRSPVTPANCA
jgi:hypothetical protein